MRGQLEEARRRKEAEARELKRRIELSEVGDGSDVPRQRIVVVGPCASGKSALVNILRDEGYNARAAAQEHSYVQTMWMMSNPSHLIYLDAGLDAIKKRRRVSWGEDYLQEENRRLAHARAHADIVIETDNLTLEQIAGLALEFLQLQMSA